MRGKFNFKLWALCAILSVMLVVPALGQQAQPQGEKPGQEMGQKAKAAPEVTKETMGDVFKARRMEMIKELKLSPDKEKAFWAVEDKYVGSRKDIIEALKKERTELEAALKSPKPDAEKIKGLVNALTSGQDALFNSFKSQRDEELALMTPVEQGKYLMEMAKMHQEMMRKIKHKAAK